MKVAAFLSEVISGIRHLAETVFERREVDRVTTSDCVCKVAWNRRHKSHGIEGKSHHLRETAKVTLGETTKVTLGETAKVITWERLGEVRDDAIARAHNNLYML